MVSLYIENRYIELDKEVQFAITKTFEDISNPTSIINDWSKTVSIPFTDKNNETFGHIYNPDRITLHDEGLTTGLYFDPLKKLDFRLEWDSAVLMTGYAKMTSVTKTNGTGRYNITLNGELGKVFQEMKKITFDIFKYKFYEEDYKYYLDTKEYYLETLNASLVKDMQKLYTYDDKLQVKTNSDYKRYNIINYTLNNGFVGDFDYKSICGNDGKIVSLVDYYNSLKYTSENKTFEQVFNISPDALFGDGIDPITMGEYRATTQIPYIFFNQLIRIFFKKVTDVTGYNVEFDETWFNQYNPYWTKTVLTLSSLFSGNPSVSRTENNLILDNSNYSDSYFYMYRSKNFEPLSKDLHELPTLPMTCYIRFKSKTPITNKKLLTTYNGDDAFGGSVMGQIATEAKLDGTVKIYGDIQQFTMGNREYDMPWNYKVVSDYDIVVTLPMQGHWEFYRDLLESYPNNVLLYYLEVSASIDGNPFLYNGVPLEYETVEYFSEQTKAIDRNNLLYNDNLVTISSFWDESVSIADVILNYMKMFRIKFIVDDTKKNIKLIHSNDYFNNYSIMDWSNKMDISKSVTINPITFEDKYILFNTTDSDNKLNKSYKETVGYNFGEKRITTNYNFSDTTKKLFDSKLKFAIPYSPHLFSIYPLKEGYDIYEPIQYYYSSDTLNNFSDDEGSVKNTFGYMGFEIDTGVDGIWFITDNTEDMQTLNTCCYRNPYEIWNINNSLTGYKCIDTITMVNANLWYYCTLGTPEISYSNISNYTDNTTLDIYTSFWQGYLDERYNTNNKIVTCYLDISPTDYMNFEFNKFIKIGNQLYMVNKIYDYDITSNSSTKVDLVTIQDIEGYTNSNFTLDYFEVFYNKGEVFDDRFHYIDLYREYNTKTIYISSSSEVDWEITKVNYGDYDKVTINGVSGTTGTIKRGIEVPVTFVNNYGNASFEVTFTNKQGRSIVISVVTVAANSFMVTKTNGVEVMDYEPLRINTPSEQFITLFVTSTETPVKVSINDITNGALEDITINGVNARDIWENYSEVIIPIGINKPLTISGITGADFSIDIELNNTKQTKIFTIISVW